MAYPQWRYFPAYSPPPDWVEPLVGVFAAHRAEIDSMVVHGQRMQSDDVLRVIADDLDEELGFQVERGKNKQGKLPRPVFFGDQGSYLRTYEIDAFHEEKGIALEVEAGRATMGNAIYRDLIQASLIVDARFLALAVPVEYRYGERPTKEPSYAKTYSVVEAIYGSRRLNLPFQGLLLIGY
ncbi:MAG TPA: hypothetical protein VGV69_02820 [Solirubrobacterales bacterium]|nr:hypothetical protein [Solirubrobacterales bacterium]